MVDQCQKRNECSIHSGNLTIPHAVTTTVEHIRQDLVESCRKACQISLKCNSGGNTLAGMVGQVRLVCTTASVIVQPSYIVEPVEG